MGKTGAQILADALLKEKVEVIFAIPGGSVIPLFDTLMDYPIRQVLCRHEQGAAHAADGYARASGKVGVCIATSGPGATNLTTGIATANFDSIPVVCITGQVKRRLIGNDAFQEADVTGITRPISKHNYLIKDIKDVARVIREAFYIARSGRPGPVVVDVPVDVQMETFDGKVSDEMLLPGYKPNYEGNIRQIKRAAELINASDRPVMYAGGGVISAGASAQLKRFAEKANIPVTTTLLGLGGFPEDHKLSLKMLGMHGTVYANYAVTNCDALIAIGARFDDRITGKISAFAPEAKVIHIDIDPTSISKNIRVDIPVVGDCKNILTELIRYAKKKQRKRWFAQIAKWKKTYPLKYEKDGLRPQYIVEQIGKLTNHDAIICTEVGQNQMWAAQFYGYRKPRSIVTSGGLGTMGFGFPASIGAQFAHPEKAVFDIAGDGSIQMNIQELATAVHNKLPIKIAIMNNGYLGMVRQWQQLFYEKRYAMTELAGNPDFVKLAEAYGALGIRIRKKEEVIPALKKALKTPNVVVLDCMIDREENVFPMVPAGEAIDRMIGGMA